jgi:hypothetical protein
MRVRTPTEASGKADEALIELSDRDDEEKTRTEYY